MKKLRSFTGLDDKGIMKDLEEKKMMLTWMIKNNLRTVDSIGKVVAEYYRDPKGTLNMMSKPDSKATDLVPDEYLRDGIIVGEG